MSYIGKEPEIIQTGLTTTFSTRVKSLTTNFDGTLVAYGFPNENTDTGSVAIFRYDGSTESWNQQQVINGPHTNACFGISIDMDWRSDRIVVGSNAASNVYIYDWDGSAYQNYSNIIESPSGTSSDFGFSVCIAKNNPDVITIGSPAHNNVFVYQLLNDSWVETFSNTGIDIDNLVPYNLPGDQVFGSTHNIITNTEYNRYGERVKISNTGEYIIVGQPGSVLTEVTTTNTQNLQAVSGSTNPIFIGTTSEFFGYSSDGDDVYMNRQLGSVRVFKSENVEWSTSNSQVGGLIYGERNFTISNRPGLKINGYGLQTVDWGNIGWGFPAHGSSVDISEDGTLIVVGAPNYGYFKTYDGHSGKVYTYKFENGTWNEVFTIPGNKSTQYGLNVVLDYTGTRLIVTGGNRKIDIMNVYDWSGDGWYNAIPIITYNRTGIYNEFPVYTADGKTISSTRYLTPGGPQYIFYNLNLTQNFVGNSLFSGYIATPLLYIGPNDGATQSTSEYVDTKRISFGGTIYDNTYENTTIENRIYKPNEGRFSGLSELILNKINPILDTSSREYENSFLGLDIIRCKAQEVHLDLWNQIDGDRYEHHPVLVMTRDACIGINHHDVNFLRSDYYQSSLDTHAVLDVNGSTYIRNKLNVNYDGRNEIFGLNRIQGVLFWDTRQNDTVVGSTVYSRSWPAPTKVQERKEFTSTMTNVTYSKSECAFSFNFNNGYVDTGAQDFLGLSGEQPFISLWLKINSTRTTDEVICSYGDPGGNYQALMITTSGIQVKFFTSNYVLYSNYTFVPGVWYSIVYSFSINNQTPPTNVEIFINNSYLTLTPSGSPTAITYTPRFILGNSSNGIKNAFIGMVNLWTTNTGIRPSNQQLYDNGPPDELLSVGGTATIQKKLGVGVTNPTEALEVSGNIIRDGRTYVNRIIYTSIDGEFPNIYVGQFNTQSEPSKIHIIDDGNSKGSGATFTVVRHYSAAPIINGEQGSAFVTYKFYYEEINVNAYYLWVQPDIYTAGNYDIHIDSPNYSYGTIQTIPSSPTECKYGLISRGKFNEHEVLIGNSKKPTYDNNKLSIIHAVGSNDYTNTVQHFGQFRILNGLGTFASKALEIALLDNGTGVIQASEKNVGYNSLCLNPVSGNVGIATLIPTYKLHVNGSLFYSSGGLNGSDDRIKYNEEDIIDPLGIINKLKPQKYEKIMEFPSDPEGRWIPSDEEWEGVKDEYTYGYEYGFIAQDVREIQELSFLVKGEETVSKLKQISVEEYNSNVYTGYTPDNVFTHFITSNVIPISVYQTLTSEQQSEYTETIQSYSKTVDTDTPLSLNYNGIFVLAVGAIQELDKKNKALEAQLASVLARLDALENPP